MTVSFDLFIIQSWDGNHPTWGPDLGELNVADGPPLLHTTFTNVPDFRQAYPAGHPGGDHPERAEGESMVHLQNDTPMEEQP